MTANVESDSSALVALENEWSANNYHPLDIVVERGESAGSGRNTVRLEQQINRLVGRHGSSAALFVWSKWTASPAIWQRLNASGKTNESGGSSIRPYCSKASSTPRPQS